MIDIYNIGRVFYELFFIVFDLKKKEEEKFLK